MGWWELALYLASAVLTAACGAWLWLRRPQIGAKSFALLLACETGWSLGYTLELASPTLGDKLLWDDAQFVAWVLSLVCMVRFAWDYAEQRPRRPRLFMALFMVVPLLATLWVFSDPLHGLARKNAYIAAAPPFGVLLYDFTGPEQLLVVQTYATLGYVALVLVRLAVERHRVHRAEVALVIFGLLLPTLVSTLGLLGVRPLGQRDMSPLCFGIAALPMTLALIRRRFLDLTPIARHTVFECIPDAVLVVDERARVVDANPKAHALFERPVGSDVASVLGGDFGAADETRTSLSLRGRTFELTSQPLAASGARVLVLRDVTEQKQAELALRDARARLELRVEERTSALFEAETRFRTLFDSAYQFIGTLDARGILRDANRTSLEFAGVCAEEVVGKPFWEGPWWRHSASLQLSLRDAIARAAGGELAQLEVTHEDRTGALRHFDFSLKPIGSGPEGPSLLLAEGRDITDVRRAEAERAALREQLHQAQKLDAIGRLAGGIAHDFNNLLTVILGQLELVKMQLETGREPLAGLSRAVGAAQSAAALTRQLLMFSRNEPARLHVVAVNEVVTRTTALLGRVIGDGIRLSLELDANEPRVCMDPAQLEQVLLNLVLNARDAMPNGGVLSVTTALVPASEGARVHVRVRDSGIGMSPEVMARVFEPFFTTKGPGVGTGLGLATVHGVVARAHGSIELESEPGKGACFDVSLPAAEPDDERRDVPRGSGRVALVEDQPTLRALAERQLTMLGYDVVPYRSGEQALDALVPDELYRIDLLVTDVMLDGMDGTALAGRLRALRADLPVLFMSAHADEIVRARGVDAERAHFVSKPFSYGDLAHALRRALAAAP